VRNVPLEEEFSYFATRAKRVFRQAEIDLVDCNVHIVTDIPGMISLPEARAQSHVSLGLA
jgi:hypothetical protein